MGQSNEEWGSLAEHDDGMAAAWDSYSRLPDAGDNDALDAFCAAKNIDIASLVRLGARLSAPTVLAFAFPSGIKYRNMEDGTRWSQAPDGWDKLKIVKGRQS